MLINMNKLVLLKKGMIQCYNDGMIQCWNGEIWLENF